jgi:hypothetical protein
MQVRPLVSSTAGTATATYGSPEAAAEPRTVELTSVAAQVAAIDELIALARRRICVFDRDLSQMRWNQPSRIDRLGAFLHGGRGRRFDLIVHDTHYLESACPRLLRMLRGYSSAMTIYRTGREAMRATDPLLIIDDRHYLRRFHFEQPRATMGIDQPELTKSLATRFEEIWATGEPGINATVLGL